VSWTIYRHHKIEVCMKIIMTFWHHGQHPKMAPLVTTCQLCPSTLCNGNHACLWLLSLNASGHTTSTHLPLSCGRGALFHHISRRKLCGIVPNLFIESLGLLISILFLQGLYIALLCASMLHCNIGPASKQLHGLSSWTT